MNNGEQTPLKNAFRKARETKIIDHVLPVLQGSKIFVVGETIGDNIDFIAVPSRKPQRFCVTISEKKEWLEGIKYPKQQTTGLALLDEIPNGLELVIMYDDGMDYLTAEHLDWFQRLKTQ